MQSVSLSDYKIKSTFAFILYLVTENVKIVHEGISSEIFSLRPLRISKYL